MEKKFSQSYSKRENALFNEMRSRRLQKWWNNRWSKIDPQERFWLILFTRPSRSDDSNEWVVKFWLWDSEENKLKCENFLSFSYRPTKSDHELLTWTSSYLAECYIEKQYEKIVIRPKGCNCYFMYDFNGTFITQTESETPSCDDEQESFSKFLNEKLFFSKTGNSMTIYELNKQTHLQPRKINLLGSTKIKFWQCFSDYENVNFYYSEYMKHFVVSAWEHSPEGGAVRSCLFLYKMKREMEEFSIAVFVGKFMFEATMYNIQVEKKEEGMNISFQHYVKDKIEEKRTEIFLPECLFN